MRFLVFILMLASIVASKSSANEGLCTVGNSNCVDLAQNSYSRPLSGERLTRFEIIRDALINSDLPAERTYVRYSYVRQGRRSIQIDSGDLLYPIQQTTVAGEDTWVVTMTPAQTLQFGYALNNGDGASFQKYISAIDEHSWDSINGKQMRRNDSFLWNFGSLIPLFGVPERYKFLVSIFNYANEVGQPKVNGSYSISLEICVHEASPLLAETVRLSIDADKSVLSLPEIADTYGDHLVKFVPNCLKR